MRLASNQPMIQEKYFYFNISENLIEKNWKKKSKRIEKQWAD